jgi:hypothetical protein
MKTLRVLFPVLCIAATGWVSSGCGAHKSELKPAQSVPAAKGEVKAKEGDNGNTLIEVKVEHLAPAKALQDTASTYVVWVRPRTGSTVPQNVGALSVNDQREGSLETVTPLEEFDLLVTPEPSASVTEPSGEPVFTAIVER